MAVPSGEDAEDDFPWSLGVFDAHCHPTDTMSAVPDIGRMKARYLIIMATRQQDQQLVSDVANEQGVACNDGDAAMSHGSGRVVPSFGWHPWFSHQIYDDANASQPTNESSLDVDAKIAHYQSVLVPTSEDREFLARLPEPLRLSQLIEQIRQRLRQHPLALVGEVGLDKVFRIPEAWLPYELNERDESLTPGGREGRRLSPYRVSMDHQRKVLLAQLKLAGSMHRAVSVHGVQAHGIVFETLESSWKGHEKKISGKRDRKRHASAEITSGEGNDSVSVDSSESTGIFPPRICLHSYSGPPDTLKQYLHPSVPSQMYFSFSTAINFSTTAQSKSEAVIKALPDDRILIESDLHEAGDRIDEHLKDIASKICELKGWTLTQGVTQLAHNWKIFAFGKD